MRDTRADGGGTSHAPRVALTADRVVRRYGSVVALADVSLAVAAGECVALVGESGAGKSTLLRCFNRLVDPDAGTVTVGGDDVRGLDPVALRRRTGYVPQDGGLLPHWTVLRNARLVPRLIGAADADALARDALALVGLDVDRYGARFPDELSGGERQRVATARALAAMPGVVLLDEPFGALDAITRADLQEMFLDVRRARAPTAVLVTHDLREALRLADRVVVMRGGRIEQDAAGADLVRAPATEYVRELIGKALRGGGGMGNGERGMGARKPGLGAREPGLEGNP